MPTRTEQRPCIPLVCVDSMGQARGYMVRPMKQTDAYIEVFLLGVAQVQLQRGAVLELRRGGDLVGYLTADPGVVDRLGLGHALPNEAAELMAGHSAGLLPGCAG